MTDVADITRRYIAAWNETDPAARGRLIAGLWDGEASYVDPLMQGSGHAQIDALVAGVHAQFPGYRFELVGEPDAYADRLRFSWALRVGDAAPVARGTDFAVLAQDGRIASVTGFLDRMPA